MNQQTILADLTVPGGLIGGPFGSNLLGSDYVPTGVPVIRGTNLGHGKYVGGDFAFVSPQKVDRDLTRNLAAPGDIVFTQRGTLGQVAVVPEGKYEKLVVSQSQMRLRVDPDTADSRYVFYACSTAEFRRQISENAISTGVPHINLGILERLSIPLPPIGRQQAVADILDSLDDKIAANASLVTLIWAHLDTQLVLSLTQGHATLSINEAVTFHNRKRIPLSAQEREQQIGQVPYYGATGIFGYVDSAIFDEPLALVGEDGSVITDEGRPVVQYIWGPAWVNNHAHVLTGASISTELLALALRRADVRHLVTGAVQPKISMGKLRTLTLDLPQGEPLRELEDMCAREIALLRATVEESRRLVTLRDALLPLLMSGKLRVRDAEKQVVEEVL